MAKKKENNVAAEATERIAAEVVEEQTAKQEETEAAKEAEEDGSEQEETEATKEVDKDGSEQEETEAAKEAEESPFTKKVKRIFAQYPDKHVLTATSDGTLFFNRLDAKIHARTLEDNELKDILRINY